MKRITAAIAACLLLWPLLAQADKVLSVPYIHQVIDTPPDFTGGTKACGATSLAMILAYYGKISKPYGDNVPEIHEYVYIPGIGADWNKLVEYAQNQGLDSLIDWSPSFKEVQKEVDSNYPLILSVHMKFGEEIKKHMITVIGYTDSGEIMIVNDPAGYYISWQYDGAAVKYPWDSLELVKGAILVRSKEPIPPVVDWPSHQRDNQNTGNNFCAGTIHNPKLDDKPMTIEGTSAYSQPIVEGHMVYLATMDGKVIASDMDKKLCPWFFDTGAEEIKLTPALVGNKLYVLDSNNVLWCLDKRTGDWIWYFDIIDYFGLPDYYWQTSPQVWQNNYVCMTVGPYAVFIYDDIEIASKGPKIAKLAKAPIQIQSEPAEFVATSVISEDGIFYCFDFACNLIAFKIETAGYLWHISEFPGPPDPAGLTYLGNPFAIVMADDILILKNNWRYDFQDTEPKPGETGFLYAVNIKTHDKILWAREVGLTSCPSIFKDNALYSYGLFAPQEPGKIEGIVYCLDPKTGQLLTDNAISVNDDVRISIGGDIMYLSCWTFKKVFAVIFDPFEILWQRDLAYHPFSAVVPVEDKAYVSMLDIPIQTQSNKAMLWPDAKTRPLLTGNIILTSFSETPPVYQKGDVSQDGQITAHDAKLIMQHVVGQIKLTPEQLELADVSGNGQVSAYDAGLVMQLTTGVKKK